MKTFLTVIISIAAAYMLLHSVAYNLGKNAAFRDMRNEADSCLVARDYNRAYHLYNAIYTNKPDMIEGETALNASRAATATHHDSIAAIWRTKTDM